MLDHETPAPVLGGWPEWCQPSAGRACLLHAANPAALGIGSALRPVQGAIVGLGLPERAATEEKTPWVAVVENCVLGQAGARRCPASAGRQREVLFSEGGDDERAQ